MAQLSIAWQRLVTRIHALVDVLGRPLRLVLTPGNASDVKGAGLLIGETIDMKRVIADRGYDANRIIPGGLCLDLSRRCEVGQ